MKSQSGTKYEKSDPRARAQQNIVCDAVFSFQGFALLPPVLRCMCISKMRR